MATKKNAPSSFSPEQLQALADAALAHLAPLDQEQQGALVDAWVGAGNAAAVDRAASDDAPPSARKAARRGLNVLKSRGVAIPERSTTARPLQRTGESTLEAWFVPFEAGVQGSVLTLMRKAVGREIEFVDVFFNDAVGIFRAGGGELSSSRHKQWESDRRRNRGYDAVQVPVEWARWRIGQARQQNARSGLLLPLELDRYADLIGKAPAADPGHPADGLGLEASNDPVRVARSQSLHMEPEFRAFLLSSETMQEMLSYVGQRISSLGRQPEQDEITRFIDLEKLAATDRFFQDAIRRQLATQMLDVVPSVHARLGRDRALDLLAAREAILAAGLITQPPSEIPFLVAFFDKTLALLVQQNNGQLNIPLPRPNPAAGPVLSAEQLAAVESTRQGGG